MSSVRARLSGGQCIVTMAYKTREGISGKTQWTYTAEQQPGHIRCTGGQWKDLSGSDRTGPVTDLIAYKGKFYWARR
jgi:hypothetical protein